MAMRQTDPSKTYLVLEAGPVVFVTTDNGAPNVMTMGFHMVMQHDPPLIGCIIGPWDHSYEGLCETGECVIAVPPAAMAETLVDVGNCSGVDEDKFARFGLKTRKAAKVGAPLLPDCIANIECRVADRTLVKRYNLFVLEPVALWVDRTRLDEPILHHNGDGTFHLAGDRIDLRTRMVKWKAFQVAL